MYLLQATLDTLGRILVKSNASGENRQVRVFLALCVLVFVPLLGLLTLEDFVAGRYPEAVLGLALILMLVASLGIIRWATDIRWGHRAVALGVTLLLAAEIGVGGGGGLAFLWFYSIPAALFFVFGLREGAVWVAGSIFLLAPVFLTDLGHDYAQETALRFLLTFSIVAVLAFGLEMSRTRLHNQLKEEKTQLQEALAEVRTLSDMLPLCSWCKKVRNDQGYWSRIEEYLSDSGTQVTHGLCPDCLREMDPELAEELGAPYLEDPAK